MTLPTIFLPGFFAGAAPYRALESALNASGIPTTVVPLKRRDWIPTVGGRSVTPILKKLDQTVQAVRQKYGSDSINLVGHSAGGWIARIYLGNIPYTVHACDAENPHIWNAQAYVNTLVCLGTPHRSEEKWTKRNLNFVNTTYPGAFYDHVRYVCIAGKSILGQRSWFGSSFAYKSYQLTCGDGECWGDGITPIAAAHLDGAENVTLDGVNHSPSPGDKRLWYGSEDIFPLWATYLKASASLTN